MHKHYSYGIGSLVIYIIIQVVVIGVIEPKSKRLAAWVFDEKNKDEVELPHEQNLLLSKISNQFYIATTLGTLLFFLMIWKPVL